MKLDIEKWAESTHQFKGVALDLFNESVNCYKIGAYRASFLMSYLAFEQTIKERILEYNEKPKDIEEKFWGDIKKNLENDDCWEKTINTIVKIPPPKKEQDKEENITDKIDKRIFKLTNHTEILDELNHYRNKRNVCAHSKSGTINSSLVECFWNFLRDNLSKFYVNGSIGYFKEAIFKAFRDRNERISITYKEYVDMLPYTGLTIGDLTNLWDYIDSMIDKLSNSNQEDIICFWENIFYYSDDNIRESFVNFIKKEEYNFIKFYSLIPQALKYIMQKENSYIFKKEELYQWIKYYIDENKSKVWDLVGDLLDKDNKYIPEGDEETLFNKIDIYNCKSLPNKEILKILKSRGFFESKKIKSELISHLQYDFHNNIKQDRDINITRFILENIKLDVEIINNFNIYIKKLNEKKGSYDLAKSMNNVFNYLLLYDEFFLENLLKVSEENNIELCSYIIKYSKDNLEEK